MDASLKERKGDPVKPQLDIAIKRICEPPMQLELLPAKTETSVTFGAFLIFVAADECRHRDFRHGYGLRDTFGYRCDLRFCPFLVIRP